MKHLVIAIAVLIAGCQNAPGSLVVENESTSAIERATVALGDNFLSAAQIPSTTTDATEVVTFDNVPAGQKSTKQYSRAGEYYITVTVVLADGTTLENAAGYAVGRDVPPSLYEVTHF